MDLVRLQMAGSAVVAGAVLQKALMCSWFDFTEPAPTAKIARWVVLAGIRNRFLVLYQLRDSSSIVDA